MSQTPSLFEVDDASRPLADRLRPRTLHRPPRTMANAGTGNGLKNSVLSLQGGVHSVGGVPSFNLERVATKE